MKRFIKVLFPIFLLTGLFGCEQFLEVELPGQEPRLVMNALLEPSDTVKVFLTKSRSILEGREYDDFEIVKDAQVSLKTEAGAILPLIFVDKSNRIEQTAYYYLAGYEFTANKGYEILAESPGFQSISGAVQYPELIPIKNISYQNLGPSESLGNYDLIEFTLKFDDLPGSDFYEITGIYYGLSTTQENSAYGGDLSPRPVNPVYEREYWIQSGLLFDDILLSGNDSEMVFRATLPRDADLDVTIRLSHVSESYFLYKENVGLQNNSQGDFLSQPVLVYTNIQNGMGILKARNTDQQILKILLED